MSRPRPDETIASGVFKLSPDVPFNDLVDFVNDNWSPDKNFLDLSVRRSDGDKKLGISFKYRHGGSETDFDRFLDQCVGSLTRAFAKWHIKDGLIGWDVASSTTVIKTPQPRFETTDGMSRGDKIKVKLPKGQVPIMAEIMDVSSQWTLTIQEFGTTTQLLCGVSTVLEHESK